MIPSYGKIYRIGHKDIRRLFEGPVAIQEKIDGSQFSAMVDEDGVLHCRSKNEPLSLTDPPKLFAPAVEHICKISKYMVWGWIYRFETLNRPKHNALAYDRVPMGNLVLIDALDDSSSNVELPDVAARLDVEPVQEFYYGLASMADLPHYLDLKPQLGGSMIEGVVIKNYALGLKGKYVAPRFQEVMRKRPPKVPRASIVDALSRKYLSEARWDKAVAHLREAGTLTESVQDIGTLIKEVQRDIIEECGDEIREELFQHHAKDLRNGWIQGLPDWYKARVFER